MRPRYKPLFLHFIFFVILQFAGVDAYPAPAVVVGALASFLVAITPPIPHTNQQPTLNSIVSDKYDSYSSTYDRLDGSSSASANAFGVLDLRQEASKSVHGDVLEIAIGTGLQSEYYDPKSITSFTGIDISEGMLEMARKKLSSTLSIVESKGLELMNAEKLRFEDEAFDTVIDTFSMCVIPNPDMAIQEMARVVKQDGEVILLENVKSDKEAVAIIQDVLEPLVTPISKNCKWNIDVNSFASMHGLRLVSSERKSLGTLQLGIYKKLLAR